MDLREQKFARLFNEGKEKVSSMDDDALRVFIEEMQDIAFNAKAFLHAADTEARERNAKKGKGKGINTSVAMDETTSNAINTIAVRQEKMSKTEKAIANLVNMGFSREDAEKMYSASTINAVKKRKPGEKIDLDSIRKAEIQIESIRGKCPTCLFQFPDDTPNGTITCSKCNTTMKFEKVVKVSNPFAKPKEETAVNTANIPLPETVTAIDTNTTNIELPKEESKPKFVNPFVKKG